jgi:uncharacterized protein DUF6894
MAIRMHDPHSASRVPSKYYFHILMNGSQTAQSDGLEFPDKAAAWREASLSCGDLIRDIDCPIDAGCHWRMEVADQSGHTLFRFTFTAEEL